MDFFSILTLLGGLAMFLLKRFLSSGGMVSMKTAGRSFPPTLPVFLKNMGFQYM